MQERTMVFDKKQVDETRTSAGITGMSFAFINKGEISTERLGVIAKGSNTEVTPETDFGVASLSKAVFAYLVLKLIEDNKPGREPRFFKFKKPFNLDTPLTTILPNDRMRLCKDIQNLNVKNVLSHQTGLPHNDEDWDKKEKKPFTFDFEPGSGKYQYSNVAITYLQDVIEELTGEPLQVLADKVVFRALGMANSSFQPHNPPAADTNAPPKTYAACDLHTTPTDYATFMSAWWKDKEVNYAFKPVISMTNDDWAIGLNVPRDDLEHVAWGLGLALQTDDQGNPIRAFHTGDMDPWRAMAAMDLGSGTVAVLCCNGPNGHILIEQTISPKNIELTHALNFFFKKFGFARNIENGYELGLTSDPKRKKGIIYLKDTKEGLRYEFISPDGKLESNTIPWRKLPEGFPRNAVDIIQSKDKFLPTLILEDARFKKIGEYLNSRKELAVSDEEMAKSTFGQGSNTAKKLKRSTTAKIIEHRIVNVPAQSSRATQSPPPVKQEQSKAGNANEKKETPELTKASYKSPTPSGLSTKLTRGPYKK